MAEEIDNSKEENSREDNKAKIKASGAELQREFMLTSLQATTRLLNDLIIIKQLMITTSQASAHLIDEVAIIKKKMKYIAFSVISMALSSIFLSLLYWL